MAKLVDDRYTYFLKKVFEMTKSCALSWMYLDQDKALCEGMKWIANYSGLTVAFLSDESYSYKFNTERSFYCKSDDTYIVLLVRGTGPAEIYVVPYTFKNVVCLTAETYGDMITRLLNLVQSQFPDGDAFIDKFLEE